MSFQPFILRRGAICIPELVFDPELARGVARNFGNRPTWVATTSGATYEALTLVKDGTDPGRLALCLGACRPEPLGGVSVVLTLQLGVRQVRCVAPLEDVYLRALLLHAAATGSLQVALGPYRGHQCTVLDWPVRASSVQSVLDLPVWSVGLTEQTRALRVTAALCQRLDEVPSLIAGCKVEAVDIAVVHVGGSPFSLDADALASIGGGAALFPPHLQ